jgi:hypothetical protein
MSSPTYSGPSGFVPLRTSRGSVRLARRGGRLQRRSRRASRNAREAAAETRTDTRRSRRNQARRTSGRSRPRPPSAPRSRPAATFVWSGAAEADRFLAVPCPCLPSPEPHRSVRGLGGWSRDPERQRPERVYRDFRVVSPRLELLLRLRLPRPGPLAARLATIAGLPTFSDIEARAKQIAVAGIMDESEAVEMLAIAIGLRTAAWLKKTRGVARCRGSRGRLPTRANGPS